MPRKSQEPVVSIMQFFETCPLDAGRQAITIGNEILRRRSVGKTPPADVGTSAQVPVTRRVPGRRGKKGSAQLVAAPKPNGQDQMTPQTQPVPPPGVGPGPSPSQVGE